MLKLPLYEGLESSYEDIIYHFFRRVLSDRNYTIRIKRAGYIEIDSIVPSAASGKTGTGSCDAYIFNHSSPSGFCGLLELESTGKLKGGIKQIRKYAKGFVSKRLSEDQKNIVKSISARDLKLVVFDGKLIYLSVFNLDTGKEKIVIDSEAITTANTDLINDSLLSFYPTVTSKSTVSEE
jgi:hypothetical protein